MGLARWDHGPVNDCTDDERPQPWLCAAKTFDRVVEMVPNLAGADREPEELHFGPGELVFEQGSRGDLVYVVEQGEVDIVRVRSDGSEEPLAVIEAGGYFGELGPTLNLPRSATARARTDATLTSHTTRHFRRRTTDQRDADDAREA